MTEGSGGGGDSRPGEYLPPAAPEPGPASPAEAGPGRQAWEGPGPELRTEPGAEPGTAPGAESGTEVYALYRRGMDLLGRGSAAAAAQLLERAAAAEPQSRSVLEGLARAQFDTGRYAAAAENFRRIVEASPADDYAQFGLGLALARTGDPGAAAEHLALAAAMRPNLRHYTDALHSVRATLSARRRLAEGTAE